MAMADKKKAAAKEAGFAPKGDVPSWQKSPGLFIAGQEEVDDLDLVAIEMERKWGADRLRLMVPKELREKFDRQRYLVNQSIWHGELEGVRKECRRMIKAWRALDGAAEAAGAVPVAFGEVWECVGASGAVYAIVRQAGDAKHVTPDGRHVQVFTLDEVAHLLDGFPALAKAKAIFPGAAVVKVRTNVGDPLDGLSSSREPLDDPIPF